MQREENEIDLGLFLKLAEEIEVIYKDIPVNTLIEDTKKLKAGSLQMIILLHVTKD